MRRTPRAAELGGNESVDLRGGAERDRTADLLVANEALSQLSYSPTTSLVYQRTALWGRVMRLTLQKCMAGRFLVSLSGTILLRPR